MSAVLPTDLKFHTTCPRCIHPLLYRISCILNVNLQLGMTENNGCFGHTSNYGSNIISDTVKGELEPIDDLQWAPSFETGDRIPLLRFSLDHLY